MTVFAFERENQKNNPEYNINRLIKRVAQKIENEQYIPDEFLASELDKLNGKLSNLAHPVLTPSKEEILEKALKQVKEDIGGFPNEKIEKRFRQIVLKRIVQEIVEKVKQGENKYELLRKYGKQLKNDGVEIGKEIEKKIDELLQENE